MQLFSDTPEDKPCLNVKSSNSNAEIDEFEDELPNQASQLYGSQG